MHPLVYKKRKLDRFLVGAQNKENQQENKEKGGEGDIVLFLFLCVPFRRSFTFDIGENNKKATRRRCNCLSRPGGNSSGIETLPADVDGWVMNAGQPAGCHHPCVISTTHAGDGNLPRGMGRQETCRRERPVAANRDRFFVGRHVRAGERQRRRASPRDGVPGPGEGAVHAAVALERRGNVNDDAGWPAGVTPTAGLRAPS